MSAADPANPNRTGPDSDRSTGGAGTAAAGTKVAGAVGTAAAGAGGAGTAIRAGGAGKSGSQAVPPRTLVLLRHGKSAYPPGVGDHDRPLAPRGRRGAALAGGWIAGNLPAIDHVLCSTAERTRQTLQATGLLQPAVLVDYTDDIYGADPDELLGLVLAASPAERTLMLVGHSPGIPGLADMLAGPDSDPDALDRMRTKFPTAAIAVLQLDGNWADAASGSATLTHFDRPGD